MGSGASWKPSNGYISSGESSSEGLVPFLQRISATYSKSEPHYLKLKDRSAWWKRGTFPRVRRAAVIPSPLYVACRHMRFMEAHTIADRVSHALSNEAGP